jgi:hypothetical protein
MENGIINNHPNLQRFKDKSGRSVMVYIFCRKPTCIGIDPKKNPDAAFVSTDFVTNNEAQLIRQRQLLLECHKCHQPAHTVIAVEYL